MSDDEHRQLMKKSESFAGRQAIMQDRRQAQMQGQQPQQQPAPAPAQPSTPKDE